MGKLYGSYIFLWSNKYTPNWHYPNLLFPKINPSHRHYYLDIEIEDPISSLSKCPSLAVRSNFHPHNLFASFKHLHHDPNLRPRVSDQRRSERLQQIPASPVHPTAHSRPPPPMADTQSLMSSLFLLPVVSPN